MRASRVRRYARGVTGLAALTTDITSCRRCPRLVRCREAAAAEPPRRFVGQRYWARPITGFGDPAAALLVLGLAPAAHGGNRTGRVFTGDRSGDFLFAALHRAGFANQAASVRADDGLKLRDCYIAALARCAPPANKPEPAEILNCREYLLREWAALARVRAVLVLGKIAQDGFIAAMRQLGRVPPRRGYAFGHGVRHDLGEGLALFASYHPSQQNTFTGKLTPAGFDSVLATIGKHLEQ
jgi:uracil-DNA glycosylase family 4